MKKILFISSTRIGDAVLSTGLLDYIVSTHPQARITVACGTLVEEIFSAFPNIERVIPLKKRSYNLHWFELWQDCIKTKWDMIVDLRGSIVSYALFARKKYIWRPLKKHQTMHKVEQLSDLMQINPPTPPKLYFPDHYQDQLPPMPKDAPILAVAPAANWAGKTWPADHFIALLQKIRASGKFKDCYVAIFAAPDEQAPAQAVLRSIKPDKAIDFIGKTTPLQAAYLIRESTAFIGNDSGLMHCAAAVGTACLGLFGASNDVHYRPWGADATFIRSRESYVDLMRDHQENGRLDLMTGLDVDDVFHAFNEMIKA